MARGRAKDAVEFSFGLKEAALLLLLVGVVVGGSFLGGFEVGHKRALRGEPSLLGGLEKAASPHSQPVPIPKVLLEDPPQVPSRDSPAESGQPVSAQAQPEPAPTGAAGAAAAKTTPRREKPTPAGMPAVAAEAKREAPATPPVSSPPVAEDPAEPPSPNAARSRRIHYQVAALGVPGNAKDLVDWLRNEGFPARIQPAASDGLYRVVVGPYRSEAEAELARERLQNDGFKPLLRKF